MLSTVKCIYPIAQGHLLFKFVSNGLIMLVLLLLPLLTWIIFAQIIRHRRWRRWLSYLKYATLLAYLIGSLPLTVDLAYQGLLAWLLTDSGTNVDAIVILGRGQQLAYYRVNVAAQLWHNNRSPVIFASGMTDAPRMIEQLREIGIPKSALDGEECSRTTEENAKFTAMALQS